MNSGTYNDVDAYVTNYTVVDTAQNIINDFYGDSWSGATSSANTIVVKDTYANIFAKMVDLVNGNFSQSFVSKFIFTDLIGANVNQPLVIPPGYSYSGLMPVFDFSQAIGFQGDVNVTKSRLSVIPQGFYPQASGGFDLIVSDTSGQKLVLKMLKPNGYNNLVNHDPNFISLDSIILPAGQDGVSLTKHLDLEGYVPQGNFDWITGLTDTNYIEILAYNSSTGRISIKAVQDIGRNPLYEVGAASSEFKGQEYLAGVAVFEATITPGTIVPFSIASQITPDLFDSWISGQAISITSFKHEALGSYDGVNLNGLSFDLQTRQYKTGVNHAAGDIAESLEFANSDTIFGSDGDDNLFGYAGNDLLRGLSGNDVLDGGSGSDALIGGYGDDTLIGGVGHDHLDGGLGDDLLIGGSGSDLLIGGEGWDTFKYESIADSTLSAPDHIIDFIGAGDRDKIDLSAIDASSSLAGDQAFNFAGQSAAANSVWYVSSSVNTIVYADVTGDTTPDMAITLVDYQRVLNDWDFVL
jgi:Ca2+-binding RTX toxin-like protein